jgi:hypothetical protein
VHPISNLRFLDPVTCHTLEAALEIDEMRKDDEDLFEDDLDTWVFHFNSYVMQSISIFISILLSEASMSVSEPESPVDSISSSQTRMSPSERIQDVLALLRHHRLSPFDLILEILNKSQPSPIASFPSV